MFIVAKFPALHIPVQVWEGKSQLQFQPAAILNNKLRIEINKNRIIIGKLFLKLILQFLRKNFILLNLLKHFMIE